jgi:HK97 family phage prohead protease
LTTLSPIIRTGPALAIKLAPQDAERGLIEGYGATFENTPDLHGDIIRKGAFSRSLAARLPAMVWGHDLGRPIGRWTEATEDAKGLRLSGKLNLDTEAGREAHAHVLAGDVTGLSIGYVVPAGGAALDRKTGVRILSAVDLYEVSPVSVPAMPNARITSAKSLSSPRELERILSESGLSRGAAAKIAAAGWQALKGDEDQPDLSNLLAEVKASASTIRGLFE